MVLNGIPISDEECIGDSLATINSAFQTLSANVENLNNATPTISVVNSPTIDLSYNSSTGTLSADITGNVPNVNGGAGTLTGILKATAGVVSAAVAGTDYLASTSLSASPTSAKAWLIFEGDISSPTRINHYNIAGITREDVGKFTITFLNNMATTDYVVVGSASQSSTSNNNCQVTIFSNNGTGGNNYQIPTVSSFKISTVNNDGVNDNPNRVCIAVF
jgi:hypothetical protein